MNELIKKIKQTKKAIRLCTCINERKILIKMLIEYEKQLNEK